jgi:hypothetical protein
MTTARRLHYSYEEYLAALEVSGVKLEYCDGEIYAIAGGTPAHADLAASITRLLGNAVLGRCRVSSSDLKVRIEATDPFDLSGCHPGVWRAAGCVHRSQCRHEPDRSRRGDEQLHGGLRAG